MSNHAARAHARRDSRTTKLAGYLFVPLVVVITIAFAPRLYKYWFLPDDSWRSYAAQVVATRVTATTLENPWGSSFLYRLEIDAAWTENGEPREAWVPTTKTSRDRTWLALWASQQSKRCIVRQSPRNPSARLAWFQ